MDASAKKSIFCVFIISLLVCFLFIFTCAWAYDTGVSINRKGLRAFYETISQKKIVIIKDFFVFSKQQRRIEYSKQRPIRRELQIILSAKNFNKKAFVEDNAKILALRVKYSQKITARFSDTMGQFSSSERAAFVRLMKENAYHRNRLQKDHYPRTNK